MTLVAQMRERVARDALLAPGRPVLVMLSGGRDSICLLDLAVAVAGAENVVTLHLNYRLRDEAGIDEQHCRSACAALGVRFVVERPGPPPATGNLQAWAREVRYAAARRIGGEGAIATGHTATDQVETVLYRLISSPSRRALLGMRPRDGALVRPLLPFTREQTTAYCAERGLAYRDDASNATSRYVRNRIRHELMPLLQELHPGALRNVAALAQVLAAEAEVLEALVTDTLAGRVELPLKELRALPRGLSALLLQHLADRVTAPGPAAGVAGRAGEILGMGDDAALDLPGGVRAVTARGVLRFAPTPRHNGTR
jgi:tRNA(Ile)-lysidine synthase